MNKAIISIIIIILIIGVFGCQKAAETPKETAPVETTPVVPAEQNADVEKPVAASKAALSDLRCAGNKSIEGVFTNTDEKPIKLAKDVKIIINGLIVVDPDCDKLDVQPGEAVYCKDFTGHLSVSGSKKTNEVTLNFHDKKVIEYVTC